MALRRALGKQFFGYGAYPMPTEDAWLSDSLSAYAACLALREAEGESAFLAYLNGELLPEAQYTLPGGVEVTSSAAIPVSYTHLDVYKRQGRRRLHSGSAARRGLLPCRACGHPHAVGDARQLGAGLSVRRGICLLYTSRCV